MKKNHILFVIFSIFIIKASIFNVDAEVLCKRATTLHNDGTHTFGRLGSGSTLTAGDAFDCDVNGDGVYDAATERFYYVTDLNNEIAVLIYYSNTVNGIPNNKTGGMYDSTCYNYYGPVSAVYDLPRSWNTTVYSSPRQIKTETGTTSTRGGNLPTFIYSSTRLLTTQEVVAGCSGLSQIGNQVVGELDSCTYLLENTQYSSSSSKSGYWLENPCASGSFTVWNITGGNRMVSYNHADLSSGFGNRPTIEVLKSDIEMLNSNQTQDQTTSNDGQNNNQASGTNNNNQDSGKNDSNQTSGTNNNNQTSGTNSNKNDNKNNYKNDAQNEVHEMVSVQDTLKTAYIGYCIGIVILVLGSVVVYISIKDYKNNKKIHE